MIALMIAAAAATTQPTAPLLDQAAHAIAVHRLEEARLVLTKAQEEGKPDPRLDHLLADLAFEKGNYAEAEVRYEQLATLNPTQSAINERAGIAALMVGNTSQAHRYIQAAVSAPHASWRAWNALGVLCDGDHDWAAADRAFANAFVLSPQQPEVLNNQGWSLMLRGEWLRALPMLEQAAKLDPKSTRIADNLELAKAAVAADLPQRLPNESSSDFAARLNDAGIVAEQQGDRPRAIAAFSQAIAANNSWDARAADNLKQAQAR